MIDLRSDTITRPTPSMRRAMAAAEVGDDVYGEDPTVNRLQDLMTERTGFEAGLLLPSGTMSNLTALSTHAGRGFEVVVPEGAHTYDSELGGMAIYAGLVPRPVKAPLGVPELAAVRRAVRRSVHYAPPGAIVLENTHNSAGGTVVPLEVQRRLGDFARFEGLPIHLDGARAFNAAVALRVDIAEVCAPFDSASLCLSKGLGAPVGTVLLGSREFIKRAHRNRKILGGGMRQAGVIAAAGIVAVTEGVERLVDDHRRARRLGERLTGLPGFEVNLAELQTNMVFATVADAPGLVAALEREGVRAGSVAPDRIRFVTHHQIGDGEIEMAADAVTRVLEGRTTTV